MKVEFEKKFFKDLQKVKEENVFLYVERLINKLKNSNSLRDFEECKKLKRFQYYSFKFREFRVGVSYKEGRIKFIRLLHRKEIYRFFP